MIVDHVTYQVPYGALKDGAFDPFFELLEMKEVGPSGAIEKDWTVRWWESDSGFQIHLVEPENNQIPPQQVDLALGHFCAVISRDGFKKALDSPQYLEHYSGSTRCWIKGPYGLRVEVRPRPLTMTLPHDEKEAAKVGEMFLREFAAPATDSEQQLVQVFANCRRIFRERNRQHQDSWRREGWRGCLFNLRRKAERAWDYLWGYDLAQVPDPPEVDDLLDAINYAALAVIAVEEGNRDGDGGWWKE